MRRTLEAQPQGSVRIHSRDPKIDETLTRLGVPLSLLEGRDEDVRHLILWEDHADSDRAIGTDPTRRGAGPRHRRTPRRQGRVRRVSRPLVVYVGLVLE